MITDIQFLTNFPLELPCIGKRVFNFTPGINVLFGPNGCGKSTIVKTLKSYCGIPKGGWTQVSEPTTLGTYYVGKMEEARPLPHAYRAYAPGKCEANVGWDGMPTFFNDGDIKVSETFFFQNAGQSEDGITDESEQLEALATKPSSGQYRIQRINKILNILHNPPSLNDIEALPSRCSYPEFAYKEIQYWKSLGRSSKRMTILFDEPERSISLAKQQELLCNILPKNTKNYQVILATHSIFALLMPDVNIIDMEEGYAEECRSLMYKHFNKTPDLKDPVYVQPDLFHQ